MSKRSQRVCPYNHVERIRELEADYWHENEGRRAIEALWTEQKARAEKAEEALDRARRTLETSQARVAELERAYDSLAKSANDRTMEKIFGKLIRVKQEEREEC